MMKAYTFFRCAIYAGVLFTGLGMAGPGWAENEMSPMAPVTAPAPPGPYAGGQASIPPQPPGLDTSAPRGQFPQQYAPAANPPPDTAMPGAGTVPLPDPGYRGGNRNQPTYGPSSSPREMSREEFMRRQRERRRAMQSHGMPETAGAYAPPAPVMPMEPPMPMAPPTAPPIAMEPPTAPQVGMEPAPVPSAGAGMIQPPAYSPYYGYGGRRPHYPAQGYGGGYGPPPAAYRNPWMPVPPPPGAGTGYGPAGE